MNDTEREALELLDRLDQEGHHSRVMIRIDGLEITFSDPESALEFLTAWKERNGHIGG